MLADDILEEGLLEIDHIREDQSRLEYECRKHDKPAFYIRDQDKIMHDDGTECG